MEARMSARPMIESPVLFPNRIKFILVNDRTPRTETCCFLCCRPIEQGYLREARTSLFFCSNECFGLYEQPVKPAAERVTRQASRAVS
jgi:ribosomal protein L24E